jgi:uncharacterized protein
VLGGVFICYRREDSAGFARLIYDRLTHKLGHDSVFFDVDNIPPGLDFVDILSERVGKCDALIAVIGRSWESSVDDHNRRRLDDPNDFVRIEIEAALARKVRVIPVLVDGAAMPRPGDLPDSLKKLTRRQGIEISHTRFDSDVERLTRALSLLEEELRQREAEAAEDARKAEEARQAADAERAAGVERERRKADEAAARAERERQLAAAEAARRADEERREREAAEAERAAREEHERREATEAATRIGRGQQDAHAEAEQRAVHEERHVGLFVSERTATGAWDRIRRMLGRPSRGGSWGLRVAALALGGASVLLLAPLVLRSLPPAVMTATEENEMGDRYFTGRGLEQDYAKAFEWYRKAADQGLADAESRLGYLYTNGLGVSRDIDQARAWYQKAADQGNGEAKAALQRPQPQPNPSEQNAPPGAPFAATSQEQDLTPAQENERGDGDVIFHKYGDAMEWYRKAADRGLANAQFNVGELYENGWGVAKDIDQAKGWYQKAADQGYAPAKIALERPQFQPKPSAQNTPSAPLAATPQEQSLTPAQENEMGNRYLYGSGVEQDYAKAMEWYRKAADHGLTDAQYNVGMIYENGRGVTKDIEQAKVWYQKAADQGNAFGKGALQRLEANAAPTIQFQATAPKEQNQIGDRYFYGRGVDLDYARAMGWYRKAADQGYAEAQHNVGALYENGWGVAKDVEQAKVWYQKAANQGDAFATGALGRLQSDLTNSSVANARISSPNEPQAVNSCDGPPHCGFPLKQIAGSTHFASELDSANGTGCLEVPLPPPPDASKGGNVWSLRLAACAHATAYGGPQRWTVFPGEAGSYVIHLQQVDSYCLDLPWGATTSGTRVQLFPCHGHINQQWLIAMVDKLTAEIKPLANPGMCMQAESEVANAPVLLRPCQGTTHQRWLLRAIAVWH